MARSITAPDARTAATLLLFAAAFANVPAAAAQTGRPDSAAFVTRLGADTLVVERVVRTPRRIEAEVLLRVPATTLTRYVLELSPDGKMLSLEARSFDPRGGVGNAAAPQRRQVVTRAGDSLRIEISGDAEPRTRMVAANTRVLPFIDMVHWPFEVALMRARAAGTEEVMQPLLTGSRVGEFAFARVGADSMTITHPTRGTMRAQVDAEGRLLGLDAGATTRKLVVERRPWLAIDSLVARWTAEDAAGRSLGALSGRDTTLARVHGAAITVNYGVPAKRGREIWGALVPYGQVWRTGANQATHFTTDRELAFGTGANAVVVPPGSYTFFSIPAREGGTLIISRETGQAGTAYDAAHDLGRVRLIVRALPAVVELFTIAVTEEAGEAAGALRLQWDRTELVTPFVVRGR
ncbi:MAG: DUF2911 domain-containing protein [Gemmatimonadota bacterium]|nr:DUF2911 domain-containing protein [Gemmatimonadota bacterium]